MRVVPFATFGAVLLVAGWPWAPVQSAFCRSICAMTNPLLAHSTFEGRVDVRLEPLPVGRRQDLLASVVPDTALTIRADKYRGRMQLLLVLRRDIYLPLVIFVAVVAAAPARPKRKFAILGVGVPTILLVGIGSIYLLLANVFSGHLPIAPQVADVYPTSGWWGETLQFLMERWAMPPGNRVIAPLLFAAVLILAKLPASPSRDAGLDRMR